MFRQRATDHRHDAVEVDAVPGAHQPVVGLARVEQRDSTAGAHDAPELAEEPGERHHVAQRESAGDAVDGAIAIGSGSTSASTNGASVRRVRQHPVGRSTPTAR